jgi:hypothetical protein
MIRKGFWQAREAKLLDYRIWQLSGLVFLPSHGAIEMDYLDIVYGTGEFEEQHCRKIDVKKCRAIDYRVAFQSFDFQHILMLCFEKQIVCAMY